MTQNAADAAAQNAADAAAQNAAPAAAQNAADAAATMNAAVYYGKGDVRFEKAPVPACREGELLVRIDACAVCGSDLKTFNSGNPRMKPPMVMGHEFTGLIETVGRAVKGFGAGERIVMATSISCGECWYCRQGWTNLCAKLDPMGFSYPGGMAEYVVVPAVAVRNGHVIKVPRGVPAEHAALAEPLSCAINCVECSAVQKGDTVVVVGAGPLGILNLYAAREYGAAKLILAAREGRRFDQAKQFACDRLVNTSKEDLVEAVREETDGRGADVAIVAAPSAEAQVQALDLVRKKGRVCLFASLPAGKSMLTLDSRKIHYGELAVMGASDSTPAQVAKAVRLIARGDIPMAKIADPILPMSEIHRAFQIMEERGGMRVVLRPGSGS
jgi:L-iditol 2-dehydrogenase